MNNKKVITSIVLTVLILVVLIGICAVYVSDFYRADKNALQAFSTNVDVEKDVISEGVIAYGDKSSEYGLIFYPGGKVEYISYEPLMKELASDGIFCILIEMPFNLAVLDVNAADGLCEKYTEIDFWYIGGHSLGGSMAASYASTHTGIFDGIVLLASYSTADLSETDLDVLSLYGSEDGVMNGEKYEKYKKNLPKDCTEIVVEGGCHAYFGMYGEQDGDGQPKISAEEQIRVSAEHISEFMIEGEK